MKRKTMTRATGMGMKLLLSLLVLLLALTGCNAPNTPMDTTPEETPEVTPGETTMETPEETTQGTPEDTAGIELGGDSELIRSLTKYLQEFWMEFDMLDTSVEIKIDEIKKGKQPLLVDFDPLNYYFVCGYYNVTHDGDEASNYCCVTEYTWVRFANANEITERYKGENIVVAFQINKAASVKDIQSETADVPNVEHFQMYTPNFDNGVNTNPSVLFDQVFIYLNSSDKSNVYHSVSVYNHEWVTLPCVKMDGQVYIMVPLYTIRSNGDHYSEAPARDLGKYYDALMNIMEPEPYGITRDNGAINFYGLFEVGNFADGILKDSES